METKTNKALEYLRVYLLRCLLVESLDVILQELMGQFTELKDKEERLGEVMILRMQDKTEVTLSIKKI